jgi:hypothetical protein
VSHSICVFRLVLLGNWSSYLFLNILRNSWWWIFNFLCFLFRFLWILFLNIFLWLLLSFSWSLIILLLLWKSISLFLFFLAQQAKEGWVCSGNLRGVKSSRFLWILLNLAYNAHNLILSSQKTYNLFSWVIN